MKVKHLGKQEEPKKLVVNPKIKVKQVGIIPNNTKPELVEKQVEQKMVHTSFIDNEIKSKKSKNKILIICGMFFIAIVVILYFFIFNRNFKTNTTSILIRDSLNKSISPTIPKNAYTFNMDNEEITYEMKLIDKKKCFGDTNNCTEASFITVHILKGKNEDQLNELINEKNLQFMNDIERKNYLKIEDGLDNFVSTCKFNCETQYFDTIEIFSKYIFCLNMWNNVQTGNHPYFTTKKIYFNAENLKTIGLNDIFVTGFQRKLNLILSKKFKANTHSDEAEHIFTNFKLTYTNNFTMTNDSLIFNYNEGDIASIASGPIDLAINFNEITDLLNVEYLNKLGYKFDESLVEKNSLENKSSTQNKSKQNFETVPNYNKQNTNSNLNQPSSNEPKTKPKTTIR